MKTILRFCSPLSRPALTLAVLALMYCGCSPQAEQSIVIRGSNTVGEELAPKLAEEFAKANRGVKFDFEFKGTSYGFGALMVGKCDIAAASREIAGTETALAKDRSVDFAEYPIAYYSVAVIVNPANPVANLTKQQVRDIFTGTIQNWKDVGGPDAAIKLCVRDPISGAHLGFKELAMENKSYPETIRAYATHEALAQAVGQDVHSIGYVSIETKSPGIKQVSIGGVAPTEAAVQRGEYAYGRLLRLYTNKPQESAVTKSFLQFLQSAEGKKVISSLGYVPKS